VRVALREWGRHRGWDAIHALRMRGSPETLALARSLAGSPNCRRRALGLFLAAQLRQRRRDAKDGSVEYALEETQQLLLSGLRDPHQEVLGAAISGLGHRPHSAALEEIGRQATHRSAAIRFDVAVALGHYPDPRAVDALLNLARDPDDGVRDWATFSLGSMHEVDTPEIRDLLWRNLQDADPDVRGEAIVGLAARGDPRAADYLLTRLGEDCRVYELMAAEKLASRGLLPALQALQPTAGDTDVDKGWLHHLQDAIKASGGKPPAGA
jgi:HEAT repeat protein